MNRCSEVRIRRSLAHLHYRSIRDARALQAAWHGLAEVDATFDTTGDDDVPDIWSSRRVCGAIAVGDAHIAAASPDIYMVSPASMPATQTGRRAALFPSTHLYPARCWIVNELTDPSGLIMTDAKAW